LGAVDKDGEWLSPTATVTVPVISLKLHQNYPNPFRASTAISFALPNKAPTSLKIYNVEGKLVRTLLNGILNEGYEQYLWNGRNDLGVPVGSGIYFYRLKAGGKMLTKKMVLLK
jgi:flagellar hook assembly protein FlgD